jgi:hypothetical protein
VWRGERWEFIEVRGGFLDAEDIVVYWVRGIKEGYKYVVTFVGVQGEDSEFVNGIGSGRGIHCG